MSFDDSICEMQLLAKDGVYLPAAPRAVNELPLSPGARADVAVYCSEAGAANLVSTGRRRQLQGRLPGGGGTTTGGGGQTATAGKWTGVALTVVASGAHAGQASAVPSFAVTRPCYLASTLGAIRIVAPHSAVQVTRPRHHVFDPICAPRSTTRSISCQKARPIAVRAG